MAIQARTEFASALNQVCSERGIEPEVVLDSIKQAILAAYRKDFGDPEGIVIDLDANSGEVKLAKGKKNITPPGFGRIAAQTAKQVILQRIREAEKSAILTDYAGRVGMIGNGMVRRFDGPNVIIDLGRAEGVMPPNEQVPREQYRLNRRMVVYIVGIREGQRGSEIIASRAHKGLIAGLFKREVPEVGSGAVEVKAIAREPGVRSKVAVLSHQPGVDPVGSCVGQKGVRVQAVIAELGEEKIDVIQWSDDSEKFIIAALSPAKNIQVALSKEEQTAVVTVPDEELSLVIGREGQNVRLAARLSGWKIDVKGTEKVDEGDEKSGSKDTKEEEGLETEESS